MEDIIKQLEEKYKGQKQDPAVYLKGLLYAKPITYWDYTEVDTLLSLQRPRTDIEDEEIFIIYHQVTELVLKLMMHELKQLTDEEPTDLERFATKIGRLNRYTGLLANSFSIMSEGLDYDQYNQFRLTLTPASGFQSAQFRYVEIYCTDLINLVNAHGKKAMPEECALEDMFQYVYWQEAGIDRKTGEKSVLLRLFEEKYLDSFKELANQMKDKNLSQRFKQADPNAPGYDKLKEALRQFDRRYNIAWPLVHLNTANTYLNSKGEKKAATGSSDWQKYLHPAFQQRKFFPELWSEEEKANWGKDKAAVAT